MMESYHFEEQLIGSMIIKAGHVDCMEIASKLPVEAFENVHLRDMYRVIVSLLTKCEAIDMFSVQDSVHEQSKDFVVDVMTRVISAANIKVWAKRVRQCWMLRKGQQDLYKAIELLRIANVETIDDCIRDAATLASGLKLETTGKLPRRLGDIMDDWLDVFEKRFQGSNSGLYLKVGIQPLDEKYGGFDRTDLIVIAGQPGMGKTELAIMMANYIGSQRGSGLFVSMEMSDTQVAERHIADFTGLPVGKLRNPLGMDNTDHGKVGQAVTELDKYENYVLDATMGVGEIIAHATNMAMGDNGLGFLCIDYLGLIKKNKAERNDLAIADITRALKGFSLQYKVPVILLSQLNRNVAGRADKRPIIQDLRDSGSIEQDADVIIFPYRDEVHDQNSKMKGTAEIIVAKYRSGEPATCYMGWRNGHFINIDQNGLAESFIKKNEDNSDSVKNSWNKGKKND
jgi:replicative DNA helicase